MPTPSVGMAPNTKQQRLGENALSGLLRMLPAIVLLLCSVSATAQPADPPPADQQQGEATLPEVLVQPGQQPAPPPVAPPPDAYDLPLSYPGLSQLEFGGLGSALRSDLSVFDSPRAISVIDPQQLTERQPRNMVEALEREVGVLMQRTGAGQASPFVRGLTGPQTLILVDGVRMNNSTFRFGPNQYFALIDPGIIERIEIVRGPQSVLWGSDAIGGVINVVTRSAERGFCDFIGGEFVERFATADAASYSRMNVEGSYRRLGVFGGGSYMNVNDLDRGGDLGRQPFTNYSQYAGDLKFDYLLGRGQLLTVALQHLEQTDVPRTDKFPGEVRLFSPQQRDLAYVRWQGEDRGGVFDAFMFTASFQRQKEGQLKRKPPASITEDRGEFDVETTGFNLALSTELGMPGRLIYGVDWFHDEIDSVKNRVDLASGASTPLVPQFPNDSYYERVGAFLQWELLLTERLWAVSGVRFTHIDLGATVALFDPDDPEADPVDTPINPDFQDWTGSVGLTYQLHPRLHLVGSISEGFRAPSLDELTSYSDNVNEGIDIPNPELSPETSINYEVGLKFDYDRLRAQTFVFWTTLDDLLARQAVNSIPDPGGGPGDTIDVLQRRNVGRAELQGFELAAELLLSPQWSAYGNLTYIYGQNITDAEPLSRIPPTQGVIGLRWRDRRGCNWFDVYGWLVARQARLSARDVRDSRIPDGGTPGYGTVNVRLGRYIGRCQRITLGIENIFDQAYRVHGSGVDGPGISGTFGYELFY